MSLDPEYHDYRTRFTCRLPARLEEMEGAWRQVRESGWSGEAVALLHRLAHSLAGACAMFGLPEMAAAARELEQVLKKPGGEPREAAELRIASLLERLRRTAP